MCISAAAAAAATLAAFKNHSMYICAASGLNSDLAREICMHANFTTAMGGGTNTPQRRRTVAETRLNCCQFGCDQFGCESCGSSEHNCHGAGNRPQVSIYAPLFQQKMAGGV